MFGEKGSMGFSPQTSLHKEGDLFKVIRLHGAVFEIRYGYYEEIDRQHDPVEIYPDFEASPVYTRDGTPFVTLMQDPCPHYETLSEKACGDQCCGDCIYVERGDEMIALCRCEKNKRRDA